MLLELFAIMAVTAAEPGAAAAAPAVTPAAAAELKPGEKKIRAICRGVAPTGTRFAKKKCVEVNAYERQQEIDRRAFEEVQNRPMVSTARGN